MLHVAERMTGLDAIAVSARPESWAAQCAQEIGAEVVIDDPGAPAGPLAGILAGLQWAEARGLELLATAPCDAPLLPADVFEVLRARIGDAPAAYAATSAGEHPLCALLRVSVRDRLERELEGGHPSVRGFLQRLSAARVDFPESDAFANANTPADLIRLGHA